jgi:hypothetical protein
MRVKRLRENRINVHETEEEQRDEIEIQRNHEVPNHRQQKLTTTAQKGDLKLYDRKNNELVIVDLEDSVA